MNPPTSLQLEPHNFEMMGDRVVTPFKHLLTADIGGETILLNRKSMRFFSTNEVGTFICARLQRGMPLKEICDAVAVEFGGTSEGWEPDLVAYIDMLIAEELVFVAARSSL